MTTSKAEVIGFIRCLLLSKEGDIYLLSEFLRDFEITTGYSLPEFEFHSVLGFLRSISDIVEIVETEEELGLTLVDEKEPYERNVRLTPSFKVNVLGKHNNCGSVPSVEMEALRSDPLRWRKKRKRNRKKNKVKKEKPRNENPKKKEKGQFYNPNGFCKRCMTEPPGAGWNFDIDLCLSSITLYENDIPWIDLRDHADVDDVIEVSVPEVSTPHRFILHLKKYQLELSKFMGKMMTFYTIYSEKYALERCTFKENEVCAALYGVNRQAREWYRAKIVNAGTDASTVFLMDYGLTVEVNHRNLRYLDRFFQDLPVQAINGYLANIRPCPGENWSKDCCKRFYNLVVDKDLLARVTDMNYEKRWLSVILSYPDSGVPVSDALIKESTVADCELCEDELLSSVVYESKNTEEFVQREDGGIMLRLRSDLRDSGVDSFKEKLWFEQSNKQLRRMLGLDVSEDESSSSFEYDLDQCYP